MKLRRHRVKRKNTPKSSWSRLTISVRFQALHDDGAVSQLTHDRSIQIYIMYEIRAATFSQ